MTPASPSGSKADVGPGAVALKGTGPSETAEEAPLIFLIAGEPSGDLLGARLMTALEELTGGKVRFAGVGGPGMAAHGLKTLFPISELAIMGIFEAVPHLFNIYRRIKQTRAEILRQRPAALVTIDAPSFTLQVAKGLRGQGIPLIHYVAPQVWAWKAWRAKELAQYLDLLLVLLPFEPPYFEKYGLNTKFVGHPAVEGRAEGRAEGEGTASGPSPSAAAPSGRDERNRGFRERHGIAAQARLICVLPGSRKGEVSRLCKVFGEGLERMSREIPGLHAVVPTVANVADFVRAETGKWPVPATVVEGVDEKHDAFEACEAALAASGTIAVELAVAGLPTVIGYRVNPLTAWLASHILKIKYASLPNLLLGRLVVPELLQHYMTPETIVSKLSPLMAEGTARQKQLEDYTEVVKLLTPQEESPSMVAARQILSQIGYTPAKDR